MIRPALCLVVIAATLSHAALDARCPSHNEPNVVVLFPDPEDCSRFLTCDEGELVSMKCSEGLHFNSDTKACDYPYLAGCEEVEQKSDSRCPITNEGNITFIPHPTNCSLYLECDNGNIAIMECPSGLEFNPELHVCDFPWTSGCNSEGKISIAVSESRVDPRCPAENEGNVTLLPHPTNCSRYLECVNGNITIMECPPGLEFNPDLLVCDFSWESGCKSEDYLPLAVSESRVDPRCPAENEGNVTLLPHPTNCSRYLECVNGNITIMECPPGLEFNPDLLVCDFSWESGCKSEDYLPLAVSESRVDPRCPAENEGNVTLLPHPTNCSRYLECVNGNITIMECPPGLEFNPDLLVCDFSWESGCKSEDYLPLAVSESRVDPRCPAENEGNVTLLPHPTNCSRYLECVNGNITIMECPPGLEFNPDLLVCDFSWESGCKSEDYLPLAVSESRVDPRCPSENEGNVTLLPHPTNCSRYLECVNGNITVMECPPGLEFNPDLLVCDFSWESGCKSEDYLPLAVSESRVDPRCPAENEGNVTLLPHPTNCSLYLECVNGNITIMECPPGLEFNPDLLVCDFSWESGCKSEDYLPLAISESRVDPRCPAENEGNVTLLPHPTNCSLYLECVNGNITVMECPSGLEFNPDLQVCDFSWESGCKSEGKGARADPVCPKPGQGGSDILIFPKPSNCSQYFECDNGNLLVMECPQGLEFSPIDLVCDHPWSAKCVPSTEE